MIGCGCDHHFSSFKLSAGDADDLAKELAKSAEQVWKKKGLPKSNKKVTAAYGKQFSRAIEKGYGKKIADIDYATPDGNMIKHLLENVYAFSAAKNYTQLQQLTQALIDDEGKLRTYSQFKKAAFEINDTHVNQWLKAEYDTAVSGAQMASKWVDITENSGTRFVEFDVVMDSKTSDICAPLHGLIVSMDDPILSVYYPPNHFNCRTTLRQHYSATPTPEDQRSLPELPQMFQTNLAKSKLVFPPGHAYFVGTPAAVIAEAINMAPVNSWVPVENNTIRIHSKVNAMADDFPHVMEVARDYAARGMKVDVMPDISAESPLHKELFAKAPYKRKCPDLLIDGKTFIDVKAPTKPDDGTLKHAIGHGAKQANYVVLVMRHDLSYFDMYRAAKGKLNQHSRLKTVSFKVNGQYFEFDRRIL